MIAVGAASVDITPEPGLPMWGMPGSPIAQGVQWPLHARVLVIANEACVAALVSLDLGALSVAVVAEARAAMAAGTHVAPTNIMLSCTHTHSGPFAANIMEEDTNWAYVDMFKLRLAEAMRQALAALTPCRVKAGRVHVPGLAFNRRTMFRGHDGGEHVGTFGPRGGDTFAGVEGPEDDELLALLAEDADGKPLAGIVNFACHPTVMGGIPVYSADFVGPLTEALQREYGCIFSYLTGAAGNQSPHRLHPGAMEAQAEKGEAYAIKMGETLAQKAALALAGGSRLDSAQVSIAHRALSIAQRRPTREQVKLALWYLEERPADVDQQDVTRRMSGFDYTFYTHRPIIQRWMAREILGLWDWQRQVGTRELYEQVEVQALTFAGAAVAGFPAEYFVEFGLEVKAKSPYPYTMVAELTNGWHGYVPTLDAFKHGGYETRLGYHSRLAPEAGNRMRDAALSLLYDAASSHDSSL